jgi:hypothetical protein
MKYHIRPGMYQSGYAHALADNPWELTCHLGRT